MVLLVVCLWAENKNASLSQYAYPMIEGPDSMLRVSRCSSALFLVAEEEGCPIGFIKAVYDGSRAMINLLSVHPEFQGKCVGNRLLDTAISRLRRRGSPLNRRDCD